MQPSSKNELNALNFFYLQNRAKKKRLDNHQTLQCILFQRTASWL